MSHLPVTLRTESKGDGDFRALVGCGGVEVETAAVPSESYRAEEAGRQRRHSFPPLAIPPSLVSQSTAFFIQSFARF